jgi:hypothetical protein
MLSGKLIPRALALTLITTFSLSSFGETVFGVRADKNKSGNVIFVKCEVDVLTDCQDVSISWPIEAFHLYLENSLAEAKMNKLYWAGLQGGIGIAAAASAYKVYRGATAATNYSLAEDALDAIASNPVPSSGFFRGAEALAFGTGLARDVFQVAGIYGLAMVSVVELGAAGKGIVDYLTSGKAGTAEALAYDSINKQNVFLFKSAKISQIPIDDQEKSLQILMNRMFQEVGA